MANEGLLNAANVVVEFVGRNGFDFGSTYAMNAYQTPRQYVPDIDGIKRLFEDRVKIPFARAKKGMALSEEDLLIIVSAFARAVGASTRLFISKQKDAIAAGEHRIIPLSTWLTTERFNEIASVINFVVANKANPALADAVDQFKSAKEMIDQEAKNFAKAAELANIYAQKSKERAAAMQDEIARKKAEREAAEAAEAAKEAAEAAVNREAAAPNPVTSDTPAGGGSSTSGSSGKILIGLAVVGVAAFFFLRSKEQ